MYSAQECMEIISEKFDAYGYDVMLVRFHIDGWTCTISGSDLIHSVCGVGNTVQEAVNVAILKARLDSE